MNRLMHRLRLAAILGAIALAAWLGWQQFGAAAPPRGNLEGSSIGGEFALIDQSGQPRTAASFQGKWRLMYFGYTFCPDICPTDMENIGRALSAFEQQDQQRAARVTPIFITVDPARDTPAVLKSFVAAFHPRFVGLTGSEDAIATTLSRYGIYARKAETRDPDNYLVDHFAVYYLFDPDGHPIAFVPHGSTAADITAMLATYVR